MRFRISFASCICYAPTENIFLILYNLDNYLTTRQLARHLRFAAVTSANDSV